MKQALAIGLGITACCSVVAQPVPEYAHLAFGRLPDGTATTEGLEISDQYSAYGVWFSLADGPGFPIIAEQGNGNPAVAFQGDTNDNVCSGTYGLTDPIGPGDDITLFRPIRIDLDPPVRSFRFLCARAPDEGFPIVRYYVEGLDTAFEALTCTGPGGGCRRYEVNETSPFVSSLITRIELENPDEGRPHGFTLSRMTVVRDRQPLPGPFIQVAQESTPGSGDFEENILGILRPWRAPIESAPRITDVYLYGTTSFNDVSYGGLPEVFDLQVDGSRFGFIDVNKGYLLS